MKVAAARLEDWTQAALVRAGMGDAHARTVARVLVWANLRGVDTHGVVRLARYVGFVRSGEMNPRPDMRAAMQAPACVLLDADRAAGPVAMCRAADVAVERARAAGIGLCIVRGTTHTGPLGYYTQEVARLGMAGIACCASGPNMAYHGARVAGVSTAPLAMAVPGEDAPIALDMASGVVSLGRLAQARRLGQALEPGWALDANGDPTTDAHAAKLPRPLGGAKGSGLALLIECLTSLLVGHPLLAEALEGTPAGRRHRQNAALIAIDIARFVDPQRFRAEAVRLAAALRALPTQPGEEILLPGERGEREARRRRQEGIPLPQPVVQELRALARSLEMEEVA